MPSRADAIWNGEREPGLQPRHAEPRADEAGPCRRRFEAYARERLVALPSSASRRDLDRLTVKLCWKLQLELSLTRSDPERIELLLAFADALTAVEHRRLEVEPPDLVERVIERAPIAAPASLQPLQAMGLLYDEERS